MTPRPLAALAVMLAACGTPTPPTVATTPPTISIGPLPTLRIEAAKPATVYAPAVRVDPPPPPPTMETVPLSDCDEMHNYRVAAGLPAAFDGIGWRESNCRNEDSVKTWCCVGWWQLWVDLHLRDHRIGPGYAACGVDSEDDVNSDTPEDKTRHACAAKALYDVVGLSAWAATR